MENMICPHCSTAVKNDWYSSFAFEIDEIKRIGKGIKYGACTNCEKLVIYLQKGRLDFYPGSGEHKVNPVRSEKLIYPRKSSFDNSNDIPKEYIEDYQEAIKVLSASPKASAALSRRLLQSILRDKFKIKENNLALEIKKFITLDGIPSHLTDAVDAIRNIGNLAAHPTKNKNTGEIVPVEMGEAEWLIEVIEALFDFIFIQPLKLKRRRDELNIKLEKIGKPPMKIKK
ncbi:DUF4145 domain-containing protein [Olleya sp. YS]|uniref:DUF4145 domain-containing protein n=1 Tax=Olleya sp. YS TaxID=3028318 RepID=UPI0024342DD8|nr:DUF4145 domain-containing protein [Olleya sp. YS]WGD34221.1 DUF4145 domain-containing protein [Olleya sp. YS]